MDHIKLYLCLFLPSFEEKSNLSLYLVEKALFFSFALDPILFFGCQAFLAACGLFVVHGSFCLFAVCRLLVVEHGL